MGGCSALGFFVQYLRGVSPDLVACGSKAKGMAASRRRRRFSKTSVFRIFQKLKFTEAAATLVYRDCGRRHCAGAFLGLDFLGGLVWVKRNELYRAALIGRPGLRTVFQGEPEKENSK